MVLVRGLRMPGSRWVQVAWDNRPGALTEKLRGQLGHGTDTVQRNTLSAEDFLKGAG